MGELIAAVSPKSTLSRRPGSYWAIAFQPSYQSLR